LDLLTVNTQFGGFVDIILVHGSANDRMDRGRQVLGRRHPIPQGDGYGDDPLASGNPRNHLLDEMRGQLRHAPAGTRGTKPTSLTTEGEQHLMGAGVTA
jgi:hypothetical protein